MNNYCISVGQRVLVVSSEKALKEVFNRDEFSDRFPSLRAEIISTGKSDIAQHETPKRKQKKTHMIRALKKYGDGFPHVESMTVKFGMDMLSEIESLNCSPFYPYPLLRKTVGSIIMEFAFGYSTPEDVIHFEKLEHGFITVMNPNPFSSYMILDILPSLRFWVPTFIRNYKHLVSVGKEMIETTKSYLSIRKETMDYNNPSSYMDHLINVVHGDSDQSKSKGQNITFDDTDIQFVGQDALVAAGSTTTLVFYNLLGILVNHPEIQNKAFSDIEEAVGSRQVEIQDKPNLPYLEAIILETARYTSFFPVLLPHYCSRDSEIDGYLIPGGTVVFPNVWSFHHDERYWQDPWRFDPSRFIEDGKLVSADHINRQRVFTFGYGKRLCIGDAFSRNRIFILLAMLLQKFELVPAAGYPLPRHDPREYDVRLNLKMKEYFISAKLRK